MKVLLSESSSLTARETITALGIQGQNVDLMINNRRNLGQFSWFVDNRYPSPLAGEDPKGYLAAVLDVIAERKIDVLIPVHEQAYLFAARRDLIPTHVGIALAPFASFEKVQSKAELSKLLLRLGIAQPATKIISVDEIETLSQPYPYYLKNAFGTASNGVWRVTSVDDRAKAIAELKQQRAQTLVVQDEMVGHLERAQAVFDNGRLIAAHTYRQLRKGPGGGDVLKVSVSRPTIVEQIERLGADLAWHGALSFDYIFDDTTNAFGIIDANPRLVEPMNGLLSGVDLAGALLAVSLGNSPPRQAPGKEGVVTCLTIMGLIEAAKRRYARRDVLKEALQLLFATGPYKGAREELTPCTRDPWLFLAVGGMVTTLLISPGCAKKFTDRAVQTFSLTPESIAALKTWNRDHNVARHTEAVPRTPAITKVAI